MRFDAIGTSWQIDVDGALSEQARRHVLDRIDRFDRDWSRFRDDSLVAEIAAGPGEWALPPEGKRLFALYRRLYDLTGGRVSPFVGGAIARLGYGPSTPAVDATTPVGRVTEWEGLASVDGDVLRTTDATLIDVGAAGKGLLVDLVVDMLGAHDLIDVTVDASGDLRVAGARSERVALEHPFDPRRAIGVVEVSDGALCASATNRRVWGDGLHHMIDGLTGRPVENVVATWALAPTAMVADGAATALFFSSPAEVYAATGAIGVRMFSDGRSERHRDFSGELFS
ncbi:thiamine biosynthesis lipoprotein [Labedella gwakjiensis]|uniref:FAD:protein FMN transferase n=2 Tax=Labedella gwakjiensis TaxID=390269 RepID=A0A2P8GY16_9MICO|nr:thiamine biosynthesis lipoprotein [Labedella gwakjiensis]RUQ87901.1 FAD:protein FMN transferase [Labedella gwakjiensis]